MKARGVDGTVRAMAKRESYPPQIKYIIGNEGCERFSFYGMKNTLTFFLIAYLGLPEGDAKATYHVFVSACYFFPLLGGWLADRFLGKYSTIFWLSIVYAIGNVCLAVFSNNEHGFYVGLGLIALGSGGIKPCVASFVGDQFTAENKHLLRRVFALFYWIINFGSFFASLLIPKTLEWFGPMVAFGIPGVLMAASIVVLWMGRDRYVHVPPTGRDPHSFLRIVNAALRNRQPGRAHWLDGALAHHPADRVEGAKAVFRVIWLFAPIALFWALYDQKGSTWIVQAKAMDLEVLGMTLAPSQLLALNPILVMLLIPFNEMVFYPALAKRGIELSPLRRITIGFFVTAFAFVFVGVVQFAMDGGAKVSVLWQAGPYVIITLAEVLVSTTGLELAYSQAPRAMKGTIMSFFNLTVTIGNLLTALISALNVFEGAHQFMFYAALIVLAGLWFAAVARRYVVVDYFEEAQRG